jgi:hypothetical protein
MPHKRDGPAPRATVPEPRVDERAPPLPRLKIPRNTRAHTLPPHHRVRRRQERSWRTFRVRLCLAPEGDAAALYAFLKTIARRHGLEVASVDEIHDPPK